MKLRFSVDQAEAFRRGVDAPKSTVVIDIDPAKLSPEVRALIADRLEGIDVVKLELRTPGIKWKGNTRVSDYQAFLTSCVDHAGDFTEVESMKPDAKQHVTKSNVLIKAALPDFDHLLEAVKSNQALIDSQKLAILEFLTREPDEVEDLTK